MARPDVNAPFNPWTATVDQARRAVDACAPGTPDPLAQYHAAQDVAKAREIETWLDQIIGSYQVLVIDAGVMRTWARLMHNKSSDLYEDAIIAATALVHGLIIVTRNTRDFKGFGTKALDPFAYKAKD